ncbi:MAG: PAS domain S-box protein [Bacteroidetes bacterium]|nr:PAS domain S-box protein [Bacteroidota bacterium]
MNKLMGDSTSPKTHFLASKVFLIFLSCCLITASLFLWKIQESKLTSHLYHHIESKALSISRETEIHYRNIFTALNRLANNGIPTNLQSIDVWKNDAAFSIDSFSGIKSIAWIDKEMRIRMIAPLESNQAAINQKVQDISLNISDIHLWIPIYKGNELEGFILGVVSINQLISPFTAELQNDYMLRLSKKGEPVFSFGSWVNPDNRFLINQTITLQDSVILDLSVAPTLEFHTDEMIGSRTTLALSLLCTLITIFAVYFAQKNYSLSRLNVYQFRELLEKVELIAATLDKEARIVFCNDYLLKITGFKREEVMGQNWFTRFSPNTPEHERNSFLNELAKDNLGPHGELLIFTRTGEHRYLAINNTILRDTKGSIVGVASIGEDITDRKRNEDVLHLQSSALNAAANAIVITDISGRIEWINQAFCELTGYVQEEIISKNLRDLVRSEQQDQSFYQNMWDTILSGKVWHREIVNKRKDGTLYTEHETITPVRDGNNKISHFVAIKMDISHQKKLEAENQKLAEQFYQSQRLDSIGKLAGGIAHDFNNLLVPIVGYAELGMMETTSENSLYTHFEHIQEAGSRAANLTRQILAFSRQQMMELRTLDLNQVISEFQKMLRHLIGEDIELTTQLNKNLHMIKADKGQLEQVLLNLSINARDAMPKGGKLIIESANVTLEESETANILELTPGLYVVLTVTDTGHGMDAKTQQHIFEPFFTSKTRDKGTGLGLATVFGIVKQHSGSIRVTSEPDRGTTFKVYFPQTDTPAATGKTSNPEDTLLQGSETILVVEDDTEVRQLVYETLNNHGYNVLVAEEPAAGLVQANMYQEKIHLLLTDVIMPQMNGPDLYKQLVIIRPDVKVLYMSGYTDNKILKESVLKKNVAFLQKPFSINGLLKKVRSVLN